MAKNLALNEYYDKNELSNNEHHHEHISNFRSPIKALAKMKRFLSEITYKANESSLETVNFVKKLIIDLVNGEMTSDIFYEQLNSWISLPEKTQTIGLINESLPLFQNELSRLDLIQDYQNVNNLNVLVEASKQLKYNDDAQTNHFNVNYSNSTISNNNCNNNYCQRKLGDKPELMNSNNNNNINNNISNNNSNATNSSNNSKPYFINSLNVKSAQQTNISQTHSYVTNACLPDSMLNDTNEYFKICNETIKKLQLVVDNLQKKYSSDIDNTIGWYKNGFNNLETILNQKCNMALTEAAEKVDKTLNDVKNRQAYLFHHLCTLYNASECSKKISINQLVCWNCGKKAVISCLKCNIAVYCSEQCQAESWKIHVNECSLNKHQQLFHTFNNGH